MKTHFKTTLGLISALIFFTQCTATRTVHVHHAKKPIVRKSLIVNPPPKVVVVHKHKPRWRRWHLR